jgi:hypothetical protein
MGKAPWWEEFIDFAFSGRVGKEEEKLIARVARHPRMNLKEYFEYMRELENRANQNDRCLELLKWLNARCQWADENMVELLKFDEKRQRRSVVRRPGVLVED